MKHVIILCIFLLTGCSADDVDGLFGAAPIGVGGEGGDAGETDTVTSSSIATGVSSSDASSSAETTTSSVTTEATTAPATSTAPSSSATVDYELCLSQCWPHQCGSITCDDGTVHACGPGCEPGVTMCGEDPVAPYGCGDACKHDPGRVSICQAAGLPSDFAVPYPGCQRPWKYDATAQVAFFRPNGTIGCVHTSMVGDPEATWCCDATGTF